MIKPVPTIYPLIYPPTHLSTPVRYVKNTIAEMEFEPKTIEAPQPPTYHNPNWFLMPVQGWFVLSIILAALLIVFIVVCSIIYNSLRKQKRKVRFYPLGTPQTNERVGSLCILLLKCTTIHTNSH